MWYFRKYSNLHNQYFTAFSIYIIILISKNLFSFEEQLVCSEKRYFECIVWFYLQSEHKFCKKDTTKFWRSLTYTQTNTHLLSCKSIIVELKNELMKQKFKFRRGKLLVVKQSRQWSGDPVERRNFLSVLIMVNTCAYSYLRLLQFSCDSLAFTYETEIHEKRNLNRNWTLYGCSSFYSY